jgi:hypothetical protein
MRSFSLRSSISALMFGFVVSAAVTVSAQTTPSFTPAQIAAQCSATFNLSTRSGEPDTVATVSTYQVTFKVDADATVTSVTTSCTGAASPYSCSGTYLVPAVGRTTGAHTLHVSVTDPADNSVSTVMDAAYVVAAPLGPVPPATNWKFIIGTIVAGVIAALVAFAHHG